ncbi:DUF6192 family protein [Streptomyces sp. KLOTTS4A1]|uniref:DUF6192 family protein n=1 Tax=Streptomyces sp. KLOTTS4A1 TaxID=3390996 RepID=UPI0039F59F42
MADRLTPETTRKRVGYHGPRPETTQDQVEDVHDLVADEQVAAQMKGKLAEAGTTKVTGPGGVLVNNGPAWASRTVCLTLVAGIDRVGAAEGE